MHRWIWAGIGFLLSVAVVYWSVEGGDSFTSYQARHANQRESAAKDKTGSGSYRFNNCAESEGVRFMALIFCYLQSQEAERDTQYAEYDLEAQQDMAEWAYALLLVSVGGLAVSSIGLALLFWSLRQTQTTIKDNRKIGQAQTRAYLTVDGGGYDIAHAYLTINVSLRNTGASPAHNIVIRTTFEARVRKVSGGNLPQHDLLTFSPKPVTVGDLQASAKRPCTIYFHWDSGNNDTWDRILTHIDDGGAFGVIAKIEWTDVFGV